MKLNIKSRTQKISLRERTETQDPRIVSKKLKLVTDRSCSKQEKMDTTSTPENSTSNQSGKSISPTTSSSSNLRRGKWTPEEEAYAARVIRDFNYGYLDAPAGTTLRTYLSEKLNCDPMRITKKFTGDSCIGKRVFHPAVRCVTNAAAIDRAQIELDELGKRWKRRIELQRETPKKIPSASSESSFGTLKGLFSSIPSNVNVANSIFQPNSMPYSSLAQNVLERTATWLDRASNVLTNSSTDFEHQINEVKQLLHEGPNIQMTSAGIPQLLAIERNPLMKSNDSITSKSSMLKRPFSQVNFSNICETAATRQRLECGRCLKNFTKSYITNYLASLTKITNTKEVEKLVGFFNGVSRQQDAIQKRILEQ